jgi:hypothetical protein
MAAVLSPSGLLQLKSRRPPGTFISLPTWHHAGDVLTGPRGERHRVSAKARVISNNQAAGRIP